MGADGSTGRLVGGQRFGPYEIGPLLGAGGAPAARPERESSSAQAERVGVGPHAHKKKHTPSPCR